MGCFVASIGNWRHRGRPKNRVFGAGLSYRSVFLNSKKASSKVVGVVLAMRCLRMRMLTSAWPLDCGWYGDETSCRIPFHSQNWQNSRLNWGPPSVRIRRGYPTSLNSLSNLVVILAVASDTRYCNQGRPEYLSTACI